MGEKSVSRTSANLKRVFLIALGSRSRLWPRFRALLTR
jgi:hypothetical protein